ncbi:MAG: flagellar filament capping protein FliD [Methylobacter sp.]
MSTNLVTSLGAGSGIDTKNLVSELVSIERQPLETRLDSKQTNLQAQISAYGAMKSALSEFQAILKPLQDPTTFSARSVSFTESNTVTPTKIDATALTGNYQVEVSQLARVQSLSAATVSDPKTALGTGTINIRFGAWAGADFSVNTGRDGLQIAIDETNNTLEGIRDAINKTNSGIQASIIKDGGEFRLLIASPTGEANALEISIEEDAAAPGLSMLNYHEGAKNLTQHQAAQDAALSVNGLELRRDTNEIKDVIAGLEFTVNKASPGEIINFSITEDKQTGEQAIRDFVEAYNEFQKFARGVTGVSRDEDNQIIRGDLAADSIAKSVTARIRDMMVGAVPGVTGDFNALATLGIRTNLDGTLSITETDFKTAIDDHFDKLSAIFAPKLSSDAALITVETGSRFSNAQAGVYDVVITTQPAKGYVIGGDVSATFPLDTGSDDYSFKVRMNGTESALLQLPDNKVYGSADDMLAELQSLINNDSALRAARAEVDVSFDNEGRFVFTSREFGASSNVAIVEAGTGFAALGIDARNGVAGRDVAGTINGVAGFGAGNVLLPALDSPASGMSFSIAPGATSAKVTVSQGLAGELNRVMEQVLSRDGAIKSREDSLNRQIDRLTEDREKLDVRMEKRFVQLQAQFLTMERIVSSLQATGNQMEGLLDNLPFTSKRK